VERQSVAVLRKTYRKRTHERRRLWLETLEVRNLLSITTQGIPTWAEQGPGPIVVGGQLDNQDGNVNTVAVDPTNPDIIFASTANGGIWRTMDGTDASPTWTPLTDQQPSLSMDTIAFGPQDPTHQTWFGGFGHRSNGFGDGGPLPGLLRTTDLGNTW